MKNKTTIDRVGEIAADCLDRHKELLKTTRKAAAEFCEKLPKDILECLGGSDFSSFRGVHLDLPRGYFLTVMDQEVLGGKSGRKLIERKRVVVLGWKDGCRPKVRAYFFNPTRDILRFDEEVSRYFALRFATDLASGWLKDVAVMFAGLRDEAVRAKGVLESATPDLDDLSKS